MKLLPAAKIDPHWADCCQATYKQNTIHKCGVILSVWWTVREMLDAHISTLFNGNCHKFHYNLFCEQVFYYFYHIYKKNIYFLLFLFFQLRVQQFFLGVQCMLMHPRRTGPAGEAPWEDWHFTRKCQSIIFLINLHLEKGTLKDFVFQKV